MSDTQGKNKIKLDYTTLMEEPIKEKENYKYLINYVCTFNKNKKVSSLVKLEARFPRKLTKGELESFIFIIGQEILVISIMELDERKKRINTIVTGDTQINNINGKRKIIFENFKLPLPKSKRL